MPNDAKLGLATGVGLVIAVAVINYRTESAGSSADPAATIVQPDQTDPPPSPRRSVKRTPTTSTARAAKGAPTQVASRQHTVQEGETFQTLARHYYGSDEKEAVLIDANREAASEDGTLTPGSSVVIPEMDE
jgi:nucleoid-associated protein YgaU